MRPRRCSWLYTLKPRLPFAVLRPVWRPKTILLALAGIAQASSRLSHSDCPLLYVPWSAAVFTGLLSKFVKLPVNHCHLWSATHQQLLVPHAYLSHLTSGPSLLLAQWSETFCQMNCDLWITVASFDISLNIFLPLCSTCQFCDYVLYSFSINIGLSVTKSIWLLCEQCAGEKRVKNRIKDLIKYRRHGVKKIAGLYLSGVWLLELVYC